MNFSFAVPPNIFTSNSCEKVGRKGENCVWEIDPWWQSGTSPSIFNYLRQKLWPVCFAAQLLIRFSISQDKIDCGISGTTQAGCEADGCCWKPVDPNPDNYPWCYKDNTVAVSIKSDLIKVLVWYSSSQMVWYSGHHLNNRLKCPLLRCFY